MGVNLRQGGHQCAEKYTSFTCGAPCVSKCCVSAVSVMMISPVVFCAAPGVSSRCCVVGNDDVLVMCIAAA